MKVQSVTIYKPAANAYFQVGQALMDGEGKETKQFVADIKIGRFSKAVKIKISDGRTFLFRGFPISVIV